MNWMRSKLEMYIPLSFVPFFSILFLMSRITG